MVSDPRSISSHYSQQTSLRFKNKKFEFVSTQFIIDEHYVGDPPKVQVGFENLNDNIDEKFLKKEISKVGPIRTLEIVRHPQTRRHLGLAKVQFEDSKLAIKCIELYHDHQMMGKKLSVFLDLRFVQIEAKKLSLLNPEPVPRFPPPQPKPQNTIPALPLSQLPFPPIQGAPPIQQDTPKPMIRPSQASLSLDDRLAKLGLKQSGSYPPLPPIQPYPNQERKSASKQYHQNHVIARSEKKEEITLLPAPTDYEEDEKAWNPEPQKVPKEKITLNDDQIRHEVIPYIFMKYVRELTKNVTNTLQRKLIHIHGYPCITQAQENHKKERDRKAFEEIKQKQANENREREKLAMMQATANKAREQKYIGREVSRGPLKKAANPVRIRLDNDSNNMIHIRNPVGSMFRRINRSAALDESQEQDGRQKSIGTPSDESDHSDRLSVSSTDSSDSSSFEESSSSNLSDSSAQSSRSSSPSIETDTIFDRFKLEKIEIDEPNKLTDDSEKVAAEALLQFSSQNHGAEKNLIPKVEPTTKKRKKKVTIEEKIPIKKQKKEESFEKAEEPSLKSILFPPLSKDLIDKFYSSLDFNSEDREALIKYNDVYNGDRKSKGLVDIPFGESQFDINMKLKDNEIGSELSKGYHPKWWNGCSRCSIIQISDKGKMEEAVDYDLQKAAIKSHVIQAANSTRRDQRNDQRRIAALNPEIDPSFLKQFTSNTLQMRAKNLRFSRSKIHKWGLFACEKIANGDAVIEYVGEKIRPSVADHREKIVYNNLPTHDGSSYFFRVDTDVIDATLKGNKARFINHSCNPNCIAKVIKHENGTNSIVIYAKQAIQEDEEITYDYKFPREEGGDKIFCRCKAPNCQKYLN